MPLATARTSALRERQQASPADHVVRQAVPPDHAGCWFWAPRRVGGRSQPGRAGGVQPNGAGPQQQRCGWTPPDRPGSVRRRRGEGHRTFATTSNTATRQRNAGNSVKKPTSRGPPPNHRTPGSPPRCRAPAGGLKAPTTPDDCRLRHANDSDLCVVLHPHNRQPPTHRRRDLNHRAVLPTPTATGHRSLCASRTWRHFVRELSPLIRRYSTHHRHNHQHRQPPTHRHRDSNYRAVVPTKTASRQRTAAETRTTARSCPPKPPAASATRGTPPNCATPRGHQTIREAVKIACKP